MSAQGLSSSIDSGTRADRAPDGDPDGGGVALAPGMPLVPYRRRTPGPRLLPALYPVCLAVADGWAMAAAVSAAQPGRPHGGLPGAAVAAAAAIVALNAAGGLYRPRRGPSLLGDLRAVLVRVLLVGTVAAVLLAARPLAWLWLLALATTVPVASRALANGAARIYRCRRSRSRPALVVGVGGTSGHLVDLLRVRGEFGLAPVGQVAAGPPGGAPGGGPDAADEPALPVLGDVTDVPALVEEHGVGTLIVVAEDVAPPHLDAVLRLSFGLACETLLVQPPAAVVPIEAGRREYLAGLPCARVDWRLREPGPRFAKRLLDVAVACALLVVAAPLFAVCAAAVRLEGGPGVLFRQRRIGLGGEEFVLLKFRTLKPADEQESDTRWTVRGDRRMGPVGRFLRDTSMDELPQLWNVVRGDMSLVGPRPERPHFVEQFSRTCPGYMLRHRVPVGMTGWAQVHGFRGDTSIELRARLDNHYIDHWSFGADLKILLLTARAVLGRDSG
ncbi:sugar transferase [Actinomadura algeriensis]|uniref:Exopolysaccharide biosynthesis polyprenyl glycosylphosphotransferase n=1 Tax=Actinomadura algeriensis TaxID=1679523 RepID=A0ABR9JMI4_9ACTN|nr:sugar transferase [Actinomadura algeriensis]MBE1531771.1 exopolysaccharide biosynthesis polyprenyl glycosylphosphotransferase [Actinomadura algeriensis]